MLTAKVQFFILENVGANNELGSNKKLTGKGDKCERMFKVVKGWKLWI